MDNEEWIVIVGDEIITKKSVSLPLSDLERLIYSLWVADYSMRNAGDLKSGQDIDPNFLKTGKDLSRKLLLNATNRLFSLKVKNFEDQYFDLFDSICEELRKVSSVNH